MAIYDRSMNFEDMGIDCAHAWAAVALGMDRLKKISQGTRYHVFFKAARDMAVENAEAAERLGASPLGQLLTMMTGGSDIKAGEGSIADILQRLKREDEGPEIKGIEDEVEAEFQRTDPLVKIYVLVGLQRAMYHQAMSSRTLELVGDLTGIKPPFIPLKDMEGHFQKLMDAFFNLSDDVVDRLSNLHTEDDRGGQILNEWAYSPLPWESGAVAPTPSPEPVKLSDVDKSRSNSLLDQVFGSFFHDESR